MSDETVTEAKENPYYRSIIEVVVEETEARGALLMIHGGKQGNAMMAIGDVETTAEMVNAMEQILPNIRKSVDNLRGKDFDEPQSVIRHQDVTPLKAGLGLSDGAHERVDAVARDVLEKLPKMTETWDEAVASIAFCLASLCRIKDEVLGGDLDEAKAVARDKLERAFNENILLVDTAPGETRH